VTNFTCLNIHTRMLSMNGLTGINHSFTHWHLFWNLHFIYNLYTRPHFSSTGTIFKWSLVPT